MKEVMAIIRMNRINETKEALLVEGFSSLTCSKVSGRGKNKVDFSIVEKLMDSGVEMNGQTAAAVISEGHRFVPKRLVSLIVKDEEVDRVVEAVIRANSTGRPGDGKIFVLPVLDVFRVRTGDSGEEAV